MENKFLERLLKKAKDELKEMKSTKTALKANLSDLKKERAKTKKIKEGLDVLAEVQSTLSTLPFTKDTTPVINYIKECKREGTEVLEKNKYNEEQSEFLLRESQNLNERKKVLEERIKVLENCQNKEKKAVTDHALVRFLSRVKGFDLEHTRDALLDKILEEHSDNLKWGLTGESQKLSLDYQGTKLTVVLVDGVVVTCYESE